MVVVMDGRASAGEVEAVIMRLKEHGFSPHPIYGVRRIVIGAVGDRRTLDSLGLENMPGVERVVPIMKPYKLVSREAREEDTVVRVGGAAIGGNQLVVIAGPCAVESREQLLAAAHRVRQAGAVILRGGAFKPRTSPYSFQGLEEEGLKLLAEAARQTGLATVTEVVDEYSLELAVQYVDMLQVGARNMQNFRLLQAVGRSGKPVLLKRGLSATVEEWLMAAEYIMSEGNEQIVLCERGIRTFEQSTRNTLDLSAVPLVKSLSHLPVIVDPSHATGDRRLVGPMARAAVAAGADGLLIEVHPEPARALCDGPQSLTPAQFAALMEELRAVAAAVGRAA
ncbi:3-deoxy-D-arabinoheptulosonate-7-phosphate synthase [Desulfofundulus australicus DSM 11792]|uniref:3-deoxy-D-arabinoheptulosonate-7-phosphate synthase n=1 Tax=Desulfofundulus australicus DSM 11792 TaxID=1121425 RepID=A0A1M4ZL10_9FIRM|nr:3-deoxy-7-phosphoheptulonate synthase [Desulfofundulus australicus]MBE3586319.1 3-deoxy-7-phosphoheptulonate synthase [Thermoanaerobacter sp.]SHF18684.1 3-deoxy-D-arabinoheptulosonate-7-phosphate synthase [Desulfofundulus australicus DSM 11792]